MDDWRCRRHPPLTLPGGGVCPHCLRDRLLRLCPDCACPRPCACSPSCASSSPSSSSSGASAIGRVHSLIEREHRVARSRSVAAHGSVGVGGDQRRPKSGVWGWVSFRKPPPPPPPPAAAAGCRDVEQEYDDAVALARSRSVSSMAEAAVPEAKGPPNKAARWGKLIPGKIKALRNRKPRPAGDWRDSVR